MEGSLHQGAPRFGYAVSSCSSNAPLANTSCACLVEESLDAPETRNDRHIETPRMMKLMSDYIRKNPQVWQSSATPPGSVRWDAEGYELRLMDIVMKHEQREVQPR
jgi:hypothetical protein